jgi:hypothetical protein
MELVLFLVVGAAKLYLLMWVLLGIFGMLATVYFDVKASALDFINWIRRRT